MHELILQGILVDLETQFPIKSDFYYGFKTHPHI